jgi:hypothetical protein
MTRSIDLYRSVKMQKLRIPESVLRNQRSIGYAGVKSWVFRTFGIDPIDIKRVPSSQHATLYAEVQIGNRDFHKYQEPSSRWGEEILRNERFHKTHYALGIERFPKPGKRVRVCLVKFVAFSDWILFCKSFKCLLLISERWSAKKWYE